MIAFSLGSWHIYRYGIMYFLAFTLGYLGLRYLANRKYFAKTSPRVQRILDIHLENFLLIILIGVMLGGRLGHVLIYNMSYYLAHPSEIFQFWQGGMSFIGGMIGVTIWVLLFRKYQKGHRRDLALLMDAIIIFVPLGIALGRVGNYLNQELYGTLVDPAFPIVWKSIFIQLNIFHVYPAVDSFLRINTNWLSILGEWLLLFGVVLTFFRRQVRRQHFLPWLLSAIFLLWYSVVRFFLEYLRADSQAEWRGLFTISQWYFVGFAVIAVIWILRIKRKK